jgi:hypothetical protein
MHNITKQQQQQVLAHRQQQQHQQRMGSMPAALAPMRCTHPLS